MKHDVHFVFCYIQQHKQKKNELNTTKHLLITTVQVTQYYQELSFMSHIKLIYILKKD
jgi:hypothetical protein